MSIQPQNAKRARLRIADLVSAEANALAIGPFGSNLLTSDFVDIGVPVVFVRNVRPNQFEPAGCRYVTEAKAQSLRAHRVMPGDLVITKMGDPACVAAVYPEGAPPGIVTADVIKMSPNPDVVDRRYLAYYLNSSLARDEVAKFTFGVTRPKVTLRDFRELTVIVPSLPEQRRIVAILGKADAIRRKRKEAIALTEELLRSAFLAMFGDPLKCHDRWPYQRLEAVIDGFDAGWSANGEPRQHGPGEYGVLKVSAVSSGWFRPEEHKAVSIGAIDRDLVSPKRGDLLFSRANTRELVAACCLVEDDHPTLFLPDKLWRIVPKAQVVKSSYLRFVLGHPGFRAELSKHATGTSGSMLNVSMEKVKAMRVPVPPLNLQDKFDRIVWQIFGMRSKLRVGAMDADALFASLSNAAFQGDLTPKDARVRRQLELFSDRQALR